MKTMTTLVLMIFSFGIISAQNQETGSLFDEIEGIIDEIPDIAEESYEDPSQPSLAAWDIILIKLIDENYAGAATDAGTIGYELVEFTDNTGVNDRTYYLLRTIGNGTNHWGTYVFNPDYCRPLVIQSPHVIADFNTGKQGIHVFQKTKAMFFMMNGTHRCNNDDPSGCYGSTSVCGGEPKFRISDMAHNATTLYQTTTEHLFEEYSNSYFIQLHGFEIKDNDPHVMLSNGTTYAPDGVDFLLAFRNHLLDDVVDPALTVDLLHFDAGTRLKGRTNSQGRFINGFECTGYNSSVTSTTGRFFHVEQEKSKLRANVSGWDIIATALEQTFAEDCGQTPPPASPCTEYDNFSFENDEWGIWNDGGNDCYLSSYSDGPNTGKRCIRIRDNSGIGSSMYTDVLGLDNATTAIEVSFSFYADGMELGHEFMLEISTGGAYTTVETWSVDNVAFADNTRYNATKRIENTVFTNATRIRLRCNAESNDNRVYIDDVVIDECVD